MILYHGSYMPVETPQILTLEKGRDFGFGFYTTTIRNQAERWSVRSARLRSRYFEKSENAVVNIYEFDEKSAKRLKTKSFINADLDWLELVIKCGIVPLLLPCFLTSHFRCFL